MGNSLDVCVAGLSREETLEEFKGAVHPKKKLLRSQPVRLEDVLLCHIPQQSALRIHRDEEENKKIMKKKLKSVTFSDEICIYGAQDDGSAKEDSSCEDGGEKGSGLRVKILLTKQEAAKLIDMSDGQQQTLKDLLMQQRKEKELPSSFSDSPCQGGSPVLESIPEDGNNI